MKKTRSHGADFVVVACHRMFSPKRHTIKPNDPFFLSPLPHPPCQIIPDLLFVQLTIYNIINFFVIPFRQPLLKFSFMTLISLQVDKLISQ